ncbi:hypothetical protein B0H19DRAFT_427372 [Mycena capillaripes]|nr:hypothetical protein B0H19DRAFT_427372 [Mycena capillaripes]
MPARTPHPPSTTFLVHGCVSRPARTHASRILIGIFQKISSGGRTPVARGARMAPTPPSGRRVARTTPASCSAKAPRPLSRERPKTKRKESERQKHAWARRGQD